MNASMLLPKSRYVLNFISSDRERSSLVSATDGRIRMQQYGQLKQLPERLLTPLDNDSQAYAALNIPQ